MKDKENFYQKLKLQLDETTKFPSDYLYKFIVPASDNRVKQVRQIFRITANPLSKKKVKTTSGTDIDVGCDTICVHSDTPNAVEIITSIKSAINK